MVESYILLGPGWRGLASRAQISAQRLGPVPPGAGSPRRQRATVTPGGVGGLYQRITDLELAKDIDARGLNCPLPVLHVKKALNEMAPGEVLRIVATDPMAPVDIRGYTDTSEHELLQFQDQGEELIFWIRKGDTG